MTVRTAPWKAKLNEDQVREIRRLHLEGVKISKLADTYGVGWVTIRDIVTGKTWRHLLPEEPAPAAKLA